MAEFNLAEMLRDVNAQDLGREGREQIQYIDIDLIDPDPKNFYELSDLDELADNIELVGLQQPLRVRNHPELPDRYMIVSGHRRRAAIRQLVDAGKESFRAVACIVEQQAASDALQELRLIYANSGTRKLTPAEISKQAERVEWLLYELKEKYGMEFQGRMRDHVAEACKVSKSKLSRLKVIRDHLIPDCLHLFNIDLLSEATAYALAQLEPEIQTRIYRMYNSNNQMNHLSEWKVKGAAEFVRAISSRKCPLSEGAACTERQQWTMDLRYVAKPYYCSDCKTSGCCRTCPERVDCKDVCAMIGPEILQLRQEKREKRREELRTEKELQAQKIEKIKALWSRFGALREQRGKTVQEVFDASGRHYSEYQSTETVEKEHGEGKFNEYSYLPFGYLKLSEIEPLVALADLFDCSVDYLLGRTDTPQPLTATLESIPVWRSIETDPLPNEGDMVIVLYKPTSWSMMEARAAYFHDGCFINREYNIVIAGVKFWQPYHYEDNNVPDSGTDEQEE